MQTLHRLAAAATLALAPALSLTAQTVPQAAPAPKGWELVALPALNFNSDEGVGYGALVEAYNYGRGARPYRYVVQPTVLLTTRGRRDITVFFDAPGLLPNGWRLDAFAGLERELAAPYYGIGNDAEFDSTLSREPNPYFYRYGRERVRVLANVQKPLGDRRLRALAGVGYAHVTTDAIPFDSGTTLFAADFAQAPRGTLAYLRGGLVWDSRDREVGPTNGWWNELLVQHVNEGLGASHTYTRVTGAVRRYTRLTSRLTWASRVVAQQVSGDVPVYDLATVQSSYKQEEGLGGSKMLRGIPKNRVMGKGLVLLNNELRWRALDFGLFRKPAFLMLSGFVDAGRVWRESIRVDELTSDLWAGYGGGVRLGLGANSVIAVDIGKSSSATQLYVGLGYAF
jgi:outer membrane protein assembly factor BamA